MVKPYKWTKEKLIEVAKKCKSLQEFRTKYYGAYQMAHKNDYFKFIKPFLKYSNSLKTRDIYCIYSSFKKEIYIGLSVNVKNRIKQHKKANNYISKLLKESDIKIKILDKNLIADEAVFKESFFIRYFNKKDWNVLNKAKAGSLGSRKEPKWTKEKISQVALNFSKSIDFYKAYPGAYDAAQRKGWLPEVTKHIIKKNKKIFVEIDKIKYSIKDLINKTGLSDKVIRTDLKKQNLDRIKKNLKI